MPWGSLIQPRWAVKWNWGRTGRLSSALLGRRRTEVASAQPAPPSRRFGVRRRSLAERSRRLRDVVRGERHHVGAVQLVEAPVLVEGQAQRLAVERLLEQGAGEARVPGVLGGAKAREDSAQHLLGARLQRVLVLGDDVAEDRLELVDR